MAVINPLENFPTPGVALFSHVMLAYELLISIVNGKIISTYLLWSSFNIHL